jgi:hypothetical protein
MVPQVSLLYLFHNLRIRLLGVMVLHGVKNLFKYQAFLLLRTPSPSLSPGCKPVMKEKSLQNNLDDNSKIVVESDCT